MSKYAVGIYSTTPAEWQPVDSAPIQAAIDALPKPASVEYDRLGRPERGPIVGRLDDGLRFIANVADGDAETLARLADERSEPIGMTGHVGPGFDGRNLFRTSWFAA